ncbi:MAG: S41 family peptidase, partial [Anaerolineales bacterium]
INQVMFRIRYLLIFLLVAAGFVSAFLSGYFLRSFIDSRSDEFLVLNQAYSILLNHAYLDLPESKSLEYGMIRGMLQASGDPYAIFQEPVQHELESNSLQGSFGGIGLELTRNQDGDILVYPIVGSPAHHAGIQDGDQLISVDDLNLSPETPFDDIKAAIRGPVGDIVKISVIRNPDDTHLDFPIRRALIHLPSVTWHIAPDNPTIGIINVNIIAESTSEEIQKAIKEMQGKGSNLFILDLRDNGGGLLTAGVDIAKLFLENGSILEQQYRGKKVETFDVKSPGQFFDLPLILLINHNTASAAEIVAGAIQVDDRALLVGQPTFGKDSIQLIFNLQDDSSLHVTAAKWWIPGLSPALTDIGLQPDIAIIPDDSGEDLVMKAAIQSLLER